MSGDYGLFSGLNPDGIDPQLTPAASELLDEYIDRYRRRLLAEASRSATQDSGRTIRLADIRAAEFATIHERSLASKITQRRRVAVAAMAGATAILGSTLGIVVNVAANGGEQSGGALGSSLIAAGVVAATSLVVSLYALVRRPPKPNRLDSRELIIDVADLERQARELASKLTDTPMDRASLSRVIDALETEQVWSTSDVAAFRDVMTLRNQIVYEQTPANPTLDLLTATRNIRQLSEALTDNPLITSMEIRSPLSESAALEHQVFTALSQDLSLQVIRSGDRRADILVEAQDVTVAVLIKSRPGRTVDVKDVQEWLSLEVDVLERGTVVVTDGELSPRLINVGSIQLDGGRSVRVVKWVGPWSTPLLIRSVMRVIDSEVEVLRSTPPPTSQRGGKFEIYMDRAGKFRFRLKARNGQIVATGEAYESKAAALTAIEAVQRSLSTTEVQDQTA